MLRVLLIVSLFISPIFTQESEMDTLMFKKYQKFLVKFNKNYPSLQELNSKFSVFKQNYLRAKLEASTIDKCDDHSKCFGTTQFMDMSEQEFSKVYLTLNQTSLPNNTELFFNQTETSRTNGRFLDQTPEEWDWTLQGAVAPIRNQGSCGGCWAFSAVSNIESMHFIKTGRLPLFSEQQLVDCDPFNSGCLGGIMHSTFEYIKANGIQNLNDYPYMFTQGICRYNPSISNLIVKGYTAAGTNDEEQIKEMLYRVGPLSITINARLLQYYKGGVFDASLDQCPTAPNHGVNIVGYGVSKNGIKYWKIRNTWGPYWGENGYFRIARGNGLCGVNQYVVSAILN